MLSPISIEGQFVDDGTLHVLVEFQYPKEYAETLSDINGTLIGNFSDIMNDFYSDGNFTEGEIN